MPSPPKTPAPKRNIIGDQLRRARLEFSPPLTQDQLSGRLAGEGVDLDRVAITKIESGTRCAYDYEVRALAAVFRVDAAWLLGLGEAKSSVRQKPSSR
jgi:hypothetical protein